MFTLRSESSRRFASAVAAVAIVATAGLTLDQGHAGGLRQGTVAVGELQPFDLMQMASVTLPGITITAPRVESGHVAEASSDAPLMTTLAVTAGRKVLEAGIGQSRENASGPSVLLK